MSTPRETLPTFIADDSGQATVEWTVASALAILLGIATLFAIYGAVSALQVGFFDVARASLGITG